MVRFAPFALLAAVRLPVRSDYRARKVWQGLRVDDGGWIRFDQRFRNVVNRRRLAGWAKEFNDPRLRIPALDFRQEQLSHAESTMIGAHTGQ